MPGEMESLSKQEGLPPFVKEVLEKASHMTGLDFVARLVLMPVSILFIVFIGAAVLHLCLMLVGGAKQPFESTYRVFCYSIGATSLLKLLPFFGGLAAIIWLIVALCIGLQIVHRTTTGKAVTAVLLPFTIFCCVLSALAFAVVSAVAPALK